MSKHPTGDRRRLRRALRIARILTPGVKLLAACATLAAALVKLG
ncbi:hypothetical protein AB0D46_32290 [Streptomyces sp. NPDC048383]